PGCGLHLEPDVLADHTLEHPLDVGDDLVEVEYRGLHHLSASEGQQLPGEVGCAIGRAHDAGQAGSRVAAVVQLSLGELRVAPDREQEIVEVVRDTAGQPAES